MICEVASHLPQMNSDRVQDILAVQRINLPQYNLLFVPGVEWILQCIAHKAGDVSVCVCVCGGGGVGGACIPVYGIHTACGGSLSDFLVHNACMHDHYQTPYMY